MVRLILLFLCILVYLQCSFWFGKNGICKLFSVRDIINDSQCISDKLQMKVYNNQLFAEIIDLNNGYAAIEERARSDLGMIKVGESFYRLVINSEK